MAFALRRISASKVSACRAECHLHSLADRRNIIFNNTVILFDQYYRHLDANTGPEFSRDLGIEVRKRIIQLNYIIGRVKQLENMCNNTGAVFDELLFGKRLLEMELLTEAFYYFAGRIRTILRNGKKRKSLIPGLSSFECEGIRNTRNKLLEHAEEKDSQVSIPSFSWGGPQGPVIRALRYSGQEKIFPDRGLYENAEEMRLSLETLLQKLLSVEPPHL